MEVVSPRDSRVYLETAGGVDVHKNMMCCCVVTGSVKITETFGSYRKDLFQIAEFFKRHGCEHVLMESTGSVLQGPRPAELHSPQGFP
jgi:hypothetical protein